MSKQNKYKKWNGKAQQNFSSSDNVYSNSVQDNVTERTEYDSVCNSVKKNFNETLLW